MKTESEQNDLFNAMTSTSTQSSSNQQGQQHQQASNNQQQTQQQAAAASAGSRTNVQQQQQITNSLFIRKEIQRFESVHPNIYSIYDLIDSIGDFNLQQQIREHIVNIEGKISHSNYK